VSTSLLVGVWGVSGALGLSTCRVLAAYSSGWYEKGAAEEMTSAGPYEGRAVGLVWGESQEAVVATRSAQRS
jgi:hypothetical protein